MRAVVLHKHGSPDVLQVSERPDLTAGPGEARIAVDAIGLNYAEVLSRKGLYGWTPDKPYVLGMEATGVVDEVGEGVTQWSVGDRVLVGQQNGSYASQIVRAADRLLPAPDGFSAEECASYGVNYMTAWVSLMEMARLRPTDRVIVTAAAGGVGTAAVQIADKFGCEVVAMAGSDEKLELARDLGADIVVSYRAPGFAETLRQAVAPDGVDVVLETVGADVFDACDAVLAPFGRIIVAGYASLDYELWNPLSWYRAWKGAPRMSLESMYKRSTGLLSTHLGYLIPDPEQMRRVWDTMVEFTDGHGIRPVVGHVLSLDEVADAHRLMESRKSVGKIVMRV